MQTSVRRRTPAERDMSLGLSPPRLRPPQPPPHLIEVIEPQPEDRPVVTLPPEGNVKFRNYRFFNTNLRAYTSAGDVDGSPGKRKLVPRVDVFTKISPPRDKILELLRPDDPGRDALEAIVRPTPRRGLARPLDDDTRRFLERALRSPSPLPAAAFATKSSNPPADQPESITSTSSKTNSIHSYISLADELKEAEDNQKSEVVASSIKQDLLREFRKREGGLREAFERERLGKLALAVEQDETEEESELSSAARKLDALLAESRELHEELAGIHEDMQVASERAGRCVSAARALTAEALTLRFLDEVVSLLRGEVAAVGRVRAWPFAIARRQHHRNYVI